MHSKMMGYGPADRSGTCLARGACSLGVLLHVYAIAFLTERSLSWFPLALLVFSASPYAIAAWLSAKPRWGIPALGGAVACLAADVYVHYSVFVAPKSSTAAIGLVAMPLCNLVLVGPLGAALLWSVHRLCTRRR